ncbi:MAG: low molecular weight phosphatase family protein [Sciscionella sp.]
MSCPGRPRRILAVCLGNHCRSPLAAAILTTLAPYGAEARSAGLRDRLVGQPASPLMIAAAATFGFDLSRHLGAQVTPGMIDWADIVLAMDEAVLGELRELAGQSAAAKPQRYLADADVPDPFGHAYDAYIDCVRLMREGAAQPAPARRPGAY